MPNTPKIKMTLWLTAYRRNDVDHVVGIQTQRRSDAVAALSNLGLTGIDPKKLHRVIVVSAKHRNLFSEWEEGHMRFD